MLQFNTKFKTMEQIQNDEINERIYHQVADFCVTFGEHKIDPYTRECGHCKLSDLQIAARKGVLRY